MEKETKKEKRPATVREVIENILELQPSIDPKYLKGFHTLSEPTDDNGRVCREFLRW
ncbi:hypothetical protein KODAMA_02260 [Serratia phage vB_SmaM-Kodama]|nr:hypothetical protein [Serratia phage BUCT660]UQT03693.1 hypothetical protein KODAMA_02260 [Serratia phage vB_SmaM-Kodama]